eukprot:349888-Pelagomonas_calceolata.AAC.1
MGHYECSSTRGGGYGAMGGYRGVNVFFNLTDLFYYFVSRLANLSEVGEDPRLSPQARYERQSGEQMSLVAAIFSFVFGDGDPNATFEERRWKALGTLIQARRRQGHLFKLLLNSCSELVLHAHAGIIAWPE